MDTQGLRVAPLLGASFSGAFLVPASGVDLAPVDPARGSYMSDAPDASFAFSSSLSAFGLPQVSPLLVIVRDCAGDFCAPTDDSVSVIFRTGGLMYDLALRGSGGTTLSTDAIPDATTLATLRPGFEIWDEALFDTADRLASGQVEPYAVVPAIFQIGISNVPLPAAGWCLASGILFMRRRIRTN